MGPLELPCDFSFPRIGMETGRSPGLGRKQPCRLSKWHGYGQIHAVLNVMRQDEVDQVEEEE